MRSLLYILLAVGCFPISWPLHAQYVQQAPNLEITRERTFEGPGLYGFMNGGSELFLEYGFEHLLEQRFTYQGVPFIAEYYLMDTPQNAYGIYSVHTFKCRRADECFPVECLTPGLLQLYHGNRYITLKCLERGIDAQPLLDSLAELIIAATSDQTLDLVAFPPPHSGYLYFVCGDLGLSAAYIGWAKFFLPFTGYAMWLRIDEVTGSPSAQVHFASANDLESFCTVNQSNLKITKLTHDSLIVAE